VPEAKLPWKEASVGEWEAEKAPRTACIHSRIKCLARDRNSTGFLSGPARSSVPTPTKITDPLTAN
jgi:hypothetical protein